MVIFIADTSRLPAQAPARPDRLRRLPQRSASDRGPGRSVDGVHGVVRHADLAEARGAYELEEAQAGLAVGRAFKIRVLLRQDRMSGAPDGAVALDVGVDHPAEVGCIALELFEVAVRLVARKCRGQHERRVAEQIVSHVRLVGDLVFCPLEDPADQRLVGGRGGQLADGAAEAPLEADFSFAHSFLCMMRFS